MGLFHSDKKLHPELSTTSAASRDANGLLTGQPAATTGGANTSGMVLDNSSAPKAATNLASGGYGAGASAFDHQQQQGKVSSPTTGYGSSTHTIGSQHQQQPYGNSNAMAGSNASQQAPPPVPEGHAVTDQQYQSTPTTAINNPTTHNQQTAGSTMTGATHNSGMNAATYPSDQQQLQQQQYQYQQPNSQVLQGQPQSQMNASTRGNVSNQTATGGNSGVAGRTGFSGANMPGGTSQHPHLDQFGALSQQAQAARQEAILEVEELKRQLSSDKAAIHEKEAELAQKCKQYGLSAQ